MFAYNFLTIKPLYEYLSETELKPAVPMARFMVSFKLIRVLTLINFIKIKLSNSINGSGYFYLMSIFEIRQLKRCSRFSCVFPDTHRHTSNSKGDNDKIREAYLMELFCPP